MNKTIVVLPDGTEISSGHGQVTVIKNSEITQIVNDGTELMLGSSCSAMAELHFLARNGSSFISANDEIVIFRENEIGNRTQMGIFVAEKPVVSGMYEITVLAFDRMILLDKDLTAWVAGLTAWPYSLYDLAKMTCQQCGLELLNTEIPNGAYLVQHFSADGITGRQIMKWIGQIAGRFCRATPDGQIEFAWYQPASVRIDAKNASEDCLLYYGGSFSFSDYQVEPIRKVQIKGSENDVGTVYPEDLLEDANTYIISGNYLLSASGADDLKTIARSLYEHLQDVTYTPCKVSVPANFRIRAGDIVQITDINGVTITAYVMTKKQSGQRETLECTGSARRDSSWAVNEQNYAALNGRVLDLQMNVEGLRLENRDTAGKLASLSLDIGGITAKVEKQETTIEGITQDVTQIRQDAEGMKLSVQSIQDDGVSKVKTETGFSFDQKGLHISNSGSDMENTLDESGMRVRRNGEDILRADDDGVLAVDVTVQNYLVVGNHARFEDYPNNRTACFWM